MSMRTAKEATSGIATYGFNDDMDTGIHSSAANTLDLMVGGSTVAKLSSVDGLQRVYRLDVSSASNQTGVITGGSVLNPFGGAAIITRAIFRASTASTGACTLDIGIASDGTTSNDTIFDGISAAATAGTVYDTFNSTDKGTNGLVRGLNLSATQYINIAEASGDSTGLVGSLWIYAQRLT